MPRHSQHDRQRKKNIALFFVILGVIALLYAITLMRMGFKLP